MKKLHLFLFLFIPTLSSIQAQIFQQKEEIIQDLDSYEEGVADDGTQYIYYDTKTETDGSGEYTQRKYLYFVELETNKEICYMWKLLEPSSETNSTVAYLKKNFVELDYMKWKDYENEIIYSVEVEDKVCIVWAWFDNKS